ncbi:hypothetical protein [Myxosarcina sp. GI1]|uniref:hypothetical protein n=1 Tax=Myxosarcina sp. GI1 TaxID=1541065 RepID=UPI00055EDA09|nr:hypothetical protein [Myxosarcina sp. GI1]
MISAELIAELEKNTEDLFALFDVKQCDIATGTCEMSFGKFKKLKNQLKDLKRSLANARNSVLNNYDVAESIRFETLVRLNFIEDSTIDVQYLLSEWDV